MKLGHVSEIKTNFPSADFWIIRVGDKKVVGKPTRTFKASYIGVRADKNVFDSTFLFYCIKAIHSLGCFERLARGTLNLKHITVGDIKDLRVGS